MNRMLLICILLLLSCNLIDFNKHKEYDTSIIGNWIISDTINESIFFKKIELGDNGYFTFLANISSYHTIVNEEWYTENNKTLYLYFESLQHNDLNNTHRYIYSYFLKNNDTLFLIDSDSITSIYYRY